MHGISHMLSPYTQLSFGPWIYVYSMPLLCKRDNFCTVCVKNFENLKDVYIQRDVCTIVQCTLESCVNKGHTVHVPPQRIQ